MSLRWSSERALCTSCVKASFVTAGAGDTATGSRERKSSGPTSLPPKQGHGPGQTRVARDTMAGIVRSGDRDIDGCPGRFGARPSCRYSSEGKRIDSHASGVAASQRTHLGEVRRIHRKHHDAPACTG